MSQFERIVRIDRMLRDKDTLRCAEVADRYEVTQRQVKRDIERKQTAVETLFRHIGILPENESEGEALTGQETAPRE